MESSSFGVRHKARKIRDKLEACSLKIDEIYSKALYRAVWWENQSRSVIEPEIAIS